MSFEPCSGCVVCGGRVNENNRDCKYRSFRITKKICITRLNWFCILTLSTAVCWEGFSCWRVGITHHQNVVNSVIARTERILEDTARTKDHLRVISRGLVGGASVKVPLGQVLNLFSLILKTKYFNEVKKKTSITNNIWKFGLKRTYLGSRKSSSLGTSVSVSIDPNVFGENGVAWKGQLVVAGDDGRIQTRLSGSLRKNSVQGGRLALGARWSESRALSYAKKEGEGSKFHRVQSREQNNESRKWGRGVKKKMTTDDDLATYWTVANYRIRAGGRSSRGLKKWWWCHVVVSPNNDVVMCDPVRT